VLNSLIGGKKDSIYLVVQALGEPIPGLNFILGTAFMERYCTVFDTAGQHVGIAQTPFTYAETN
jgi:cathepsin E